MPEAAKRSPYINLGDHAESFEYLVDWCQKNPVAARMMGKLLYEASISACDPGCPCQGPKNPGEVQQ